MTSLPVPDSPVMRMLAFRRYPPLCSAMASVRSHRLRAMDDGMRFLRNRFEHGGDQLFSSGGSGIYSFAPARMAAAAALESISMPQAISVAR